MEQTDNAELISRGHQAQRLLEDPLLVESLDILERGAIERLRAADVNDTKTLQTLVMGLQATNGFRSALQNVLITGKNALAQEEQKGLLAHARGAIRRFAA
jgi:hypothetical protein